MSVRIGHASLNEHKRISGGQPGDQTGGEVCVRSWYNRPWALLLRPINDVIAEKSARACEAGCANNNIGYSQPKRNTAHTQAKAVGYDLSKIIYPCETDCSAFMTLCAIAAGVTALEYPVNGNAPTTSTMKNVFVNTGQYKALTEKKYLTSDAYLRRGDILVTPGKHTVMVLDNGRAFDSSMTVIVPTLRKGSKGAQVSLLQERLNVKCGFNLAVDGDFGKNTDAAVRQFQKINRLVVDGIVGVKTCAVLNA